MPLPTGKKDLDPAGEWQVERSIVERVHDGLATDGQRPWPRGRCHAESCSGAAIIGASAEGNVWQWRKTTDHRSSEGRDPVAGVGESLASAAIRRITFHERVGSIQWHFVPG